MLLGEDGEELGFNPFKAVGKVARVVVKPVGKLATTAGGVVGGPWGAALKVGGGVLTSVGGKSAPPPPPPCTFGEKVKRFFGGKPNCT